MQTVAINWQRNWEMKLDEKPSIPCCSTCNGLNFKIKECAKCSEYSCESCVEWVGNQYVCRNCDNQK